MHDDLWSNQSAALLQRDAFRNDETVRHCSGRGRGSGVGADAFSTRMPVATLPRKRKPDSFPFQVYLEDVSRETPHGVPSKRNVQSYENVDGKTKKQKKTRAKKEGQSGIRNYGGTCTNRGSNYGDFSCNTPSGIAFHVRFFWSSDRVPHWAVNSPNARTRIRDLQQEKSP